MQDAIILFGHGSRDPLWRQPIDAIAARVAARRPPGTVLCAFLELNQPELPAAAAELVAAGARSITIVPVFLGTGRHAREDLPRLVEDLRARHRTVAFRLRPALGEDPRVLDLLADIARE